MISGESRTADRRPDGSTRPLGFSRPAKPAVPLPSGRSGRSRTAPTDGPAGSGSYQSRLSALRVTIYIVSPVFRLTNVKGRVDASAQQIDGEFTVLEGSHVVATWHGVGKAASTIKQYDYFRAQHEQLLDQGDIVIEDGRGRLTRNLVFTSPSLAGAIALGRSCNGRREWVTGDGMSFGDWEERGVE